MGHSLAGQKANKKFIERLKKQNMLFILILKGREGREEEMGRNINVWLLLMYPQLGTWPATQTCAPIGN